MRTVPGRTDRVVVVGAGLGGLSAALHLAGRGRRVTVVERGHQPGGRAGRLQLRGYQLDTGPTVLTMPEIIDETLHAVGDSLHSRLSLVRLDPAYRAHFADGSDLDVHSDAGQMAEAIRAFAGGVEAAGYLRLREWLTRLYRVEFEQFIASNVDSPLNLLSPQLARLVAMGAFRSLDHAIGRFISDERLRRVFSFQSLYAGESPRHALALYAVIAYMDTVSGVYFPQGGVHALPRALAGAARDAGVTFRYGETVDSLERDKWQVRAVRTSSGERLPCDAVVLGTETHTAYRLLQRTPRRWRPLRAAPSAVVLHAGSTGYWPGIAHHSISFGHAWDTTFDEIIRDGSLMSDPSLLITRPTATDPTLAPDGRELFSILAPAPNLRSGNQAWRYLGEHYAVELVRTIEDRLMPGFGADVDATYLLTPRDWQQQDMVEGTPFSYAHTFVQTGPFRPRNVPRGVDNVVLAGAGTVPGVGVPTVLISGRLAADRITGPRRHVARKVIHPRMKAARS